jgi:hypothetical protein
VRSDVLEADGKKMHPNPMLLITLDSCRYDTFLAANAPHMKAIGHLHRAMAPATFTFGSHASMFVGFTPGTPDIAAPFVNPKYAKIFKLDQAGFPGYSEPLFSLTGRNIIEGFKMKGNLALGCGGLGRKYLQSSTTLLAENDFCHRFDRRWWCNWEIFASHMQDTRPRIECRNPSGNKLARVARDDNEVFQRGNRRDEQVWLSEGVAALLPFDHHRFPAYDDVLSDREDASDEERTQRSVEPQVNVGAAARILKLFDAESDFAECNFRVEKPLTSLSGDELSNR